VKLAVETPNGLNARAIFRNFQKTVNRIFAGSFESYPTPTYIFDMTHSFLQKFLCVGFAAEFVLTRRRLFRQTCLYGGRNRRQIAA
jgi:hypothetical protein